MSLKRNHIILLSLLTGIYTLLFTLQTHDPRIIACFSIALALITFCTCLLAKRISKVFSITGHWELKQVIQLFSLALSVFGTILILQVGVIGIFETLKVEDLPKNLNNPYVLSLFTYLITLSYLYNELRHQHISEELKTKDKLFSKNKLELVKKQQELESLKDQIQPHFLFNTLNTLYGLAMIDSTHTAPAILKLSSLMDYILYTSSKESVSIDQEITFIEAYIGLEQLRFTDSLTINFDHKIDHHQLSIAPLILLPIIENAFKYGHIENGEISISISQKQNKLILLATNNYKRIEVEKSHGIGLNNLKSRLTLIYPNEHRLVIMDENEVFRVELELCLSN